ncbi:MAG: beta-N-acetylhexosaminidase [Sphingobacteriaceae bacterium]
MNKLLLRICALCLVVATVLPANAQSVLKTSDISIIPQPQSLKVLPGAFTVNNKSKIYFNGANTDLKAIAEQLSDQLNELTGYKIPVASAVANIPSGSILLTTKNAPASLGDEGYSLSVNPGKIVVTGKTAHGVFYGVQSIYQLLPFKGKKLAQFTIPAVSITDNPRFEWRGLMLDVGRYFYSVDFLKKYIDYLAMHKMNTFHWHLTEDHGWRIEIKKYPRLTEIGAQRAGTQFDRSKLQDNNPHWGYYTQEQIKEVVAYAKQRFVTVVPEIEMPGHTLAVLAAYPELSCTGGPFEMPVRWGIQKDIYCAGNEQTFKFLEDVLSEVVELFPGQVVHIGGDEAPKDRWKACAKCQARIKTEGLKDEHELQSYFIKRIENFLLTKNRRIIGWDEILEGGLAPNAAVMSWRGVKGGIAAAKQKHDVVMTPSTFLYLDFYQGEPYLEPMAIGGLSTLQKVYSYEPVAEELTADEAKYIKGVQGNVWSEYIHSPAKVEYMTFPRAAAVAEIAWTQPQFKNWDSFKKRMEFGYKRYDDLGINYSMSAYNVWHTVKIDSVAKKATVSFETDSHNPEIRYTVDGSEPTCQSIKYDKPFVVNFPITIKAANFKNGKQVGKTSARSVVLPADPKPQS